MSKSSLITPCPAPPADVRQHRFLISSTHDLNNDTSTTLDFTRALGPSIRNSRPRRSSLLHGKAIKHAPVTIFEDVIEDEELLRSQSQPVLKGQTLLCRPAKKMVLVSDKTAATTVAAPPNKQQSRATLPSHPERRQSRANFNRDGVATQRTGLRDIDQGRTRSSILRTNRTVATMSKDDTITSNAARSQSQLEMRARRRTMFIPEDTTVLTIHPGADNTARVDDTFHLAGFAYQPPHQHDVVQEHEQERSVLQKPVRRPRKSLMAAPRRGPLVAQDVEHKQNIESWDVCGENTGKENLPPTGLAKFKTTAADSPETQLHNCQAPHSKHKPQIKPSLNRQDGIPRNTAPLRGGLTNTSMAVSKPRASINIMTDVRSIGGTRQRNNVSRLSFSIEGRRHSRILLENVARGPHIPKFSEAEEKQDLRATIATKRLEMYRARSKQFPVLTESLCHTSLYQSEWLDQQEVALTEVVNEIFHMASPTTTESTPQDKLREILIRIYDQDEVVMMHSRVQASIKVGWLSKPKAMSSPEVGHDLALNKQFVNLWVGNYTEELLRAAMEVVVGRMVEEPTVQLKCDPKARRRALLNFVQTYFVFVADVECSEGAHPDGAVEVTARWQKRMERSLMVVWLLDQAKTSGLISSTLFKEISNHKSSVGMLQDLSKILNNSAGDIVRILHNLDYEVNHVQNPLDEVNYHMENLAVDLRDGIMLSHLVEILLYARPVIPEPSCDDHDTLTITMPDTTILKSDFYTPELGYKNRVLSQHLKIPCLSRALKVYNVQIALSAIENSGLCGANIVANISADDIVNGHREKSLSLLWSLVSVYGLGYLIDWKELARDVNRTQAMLRKTTARAVDMEINTSKQEDLLLFSWADLHLWKAGMGRVKNHNTSFTDGSPYLAIIEGFEPYIMESLADCSPPAAGRTLIDLRVQLERIGCSAAFIKQLISSVGIIPHEYTVISNLAFLATRLLPLSKKHFAAVTIQRAYRKHRALTIASKRVMLMRLAHDCVPDAQAKQFKYAAATIIQRAWRAHLDHVYSSITQGAVDFQSLARGFSARNALKPSSLVKKGGRVMGGW